MAYNLIQTEPFQKDLSAVTHYIAVSPSNKPAAASLLSAIETCYDNLALTPLMYEACRDPYLKSLGYRKAVVHNYILIYKVEEASKTVCIMRLFHGRQDYEKLI